MSPVSIGFLYGSYWGYLGVRKGSIVAAAVICEDVIIFDDDYNYELFCRCI